MVKFHMPVEFQFNIPMRVYFFFSLQINIENADKVSKINKAFTEIQKEVQQLSKGPVVEPQKNNQVSTHPEAEPANVDAATSLLSQL
uniref:Uncharacterized protein n=1 Tax=Anser brachyrhynchus TaxID=132585 RepID=A0A8B9C7E7_9AVES